jgi:hypothetical protein
MYVRQILVGQMSFGIMPFGQMFFDQKTWNLSAVTIGVKFNLMSPVISSLNVNLIKLFLCFVTKSHMRDRRL